MFPQLNSQQKSFKKLSKDDKSSDYINYYDEPIDNDKNIN